MRNPTTKEEAAKVKYGPPYRAQAYNPDRCVAHVWQPRAWGSVQCARKPGYGPDGLYCKQHDPAAVLARQGEAERRYQAERAAYRAKHAKAQAEAALIAAAKAAVRQVGTWDAVADAVAALEAAEREGE